MNIVDRFLKYVSFCTTSDENTGMTPSTPGQMEFAHYLAEELKSIGLTEVSLDENGYIMATLPANGLGVPTIGFIAHMDTAPDASGKNIKPRIIKAYDGKDFELSEGIVFETAKYPEILNYVGQDIIVTNGKTLLGADDKAGIAEIVTAMEYLVQHPEIKHGKVRVGFTPDEEIGCGADHFDVKAFGCDFAYTMDGGAIGELEYENFNAASANIKIQGRNIHPGYAKNKMVNAQLIAMEFNSMLPEAQKPQYTQDYEGFYLLVHMEGTVENASLTYIIRDHDRAKFEQKKQVIAQCGDFINARYGAGTATVTVKDQYYNMREQVEPHYHVVEKAVKAMEMAGVKPRIQPIRGGTDGANLSFRGLPCPNIFAGGLNFHGKFEWVTVENMEKAAAVIRNLISLYV